MDRLFAACRAGDREAVLLALQEGADVDAVLDGYSLISAAADAGREEVVRLLLQRGATVAFHLTGYDDHRCPLHKALARGHGSIASMMIAAGATLVRTHVDDRAPLASALRVSLGLFKAVLGRYRNALEAEAASFGHLQLGEDYNTEWIVARELCSEMCEVQEKTAVSALAALVDAGFGRLGVVALADRYRPGGHDRETQRVRLMVRFARQLVTWADQLTGDQGIDFSGSRDFRGRDTDTLLHSMAMFASSTSALELPPVDWSCVSLQTDARNALVAILKALPSSLDAANAKDDNGATALDYLISKGHADDSDTQLHGRARASAGYYRCDCGRRRSACDTTARGPLSI